MSEGFKAFASVIRAHAAVTHTAKAHLGSGKVHDGIVDATASKGKLLLPSLHNGALAGKEVGCQRLLAA